MIHLMIQALDFQKNYFNFASFPGVCFETEQHNQVKCNHIQVVNNDVHKIMECFHQKTFTDNKVHNPIYYLSIKFGNESTPYKLLQILGASEK